MMTCDGKPVEPSSSTNRRFQSGVFTGELQHYTLSISTSHKILKPHNVDWLILTIFASSSAFTITFSHSQMARISSINKIKGSFKSFKDLRFQSLMLSEMKWEKGSNNISQSCSRSYLCETGSGSGEEEPYSVFSGEEELVIWKEEHRDAGILVISHCFHLFLKQFGQPGPVAQILEMDVPYMRRNLRKTSIIASGGFIIGVLFGIVAFISVVILIKIKASLDYASSIIIILANSASPEVFRLAAELKFLTSETGRLAVCASLISEMSCVLLSSIVHSASWEYFGKGILLLLLTIALIVVSKYLAFWCNQRTRNQKYVTHAEFLVFLSLLVTAALLIEKYGYISTSTSFLLGLMFPREGKTTRSLLHKLSYATYNFILPVYFGCIGFQFDVSHMGSFRSFIMVVMMIFMSIASKLIGTLFACHYLKIPTDEGIVLGFLLDLKGNAEFHIMRNLPKDTLSPMEQESVQNLGVSVVVMNTVIAGVVVAHILRKKLEYFSHSHTSLELGEHESELRVLACVYGSRHISSKIRLISVFSESLKTLVTAYLMHLVELPRKRTKKNLMYHQLQDGDQYSDEEDYGGNDVVEINDVVDAYTIETKVLIRQSKVVSSFERMYEDVCDSH
ncbi:hypothetical protein DKX38_005082 [Salix brachista]|uniref:Cation/H+ exchanger transmembrane domain-containing protein n=1 Tax=Salix brachista TaxID=2182728 RepID=A0A5N5ND89_9ROSI|nr:hypothetical protein DKX38_005082 [Salix brachista]